MVTPNPNSNQEPTRATDRARLALTRLTPGSDATLADIFRQACRTGAETLQTARASVWLLTDEGRVLRCTHLYERESNQHSRGAQLQVADFPRYLDALRTRKTLPAESAVVDPRTSELADAYLQPLGITSMLDAPILVGGEFAGVVCFEHTGTPREWSTEERDFAGSIADLLALKVRAAEVAQLQELLRGQEGLAAAVNKAEAIAQLAAGVAHDFGSLLMVVSGTALMMRDSPLLPASFRAEIDAIVEASERGAALVAELRRLGRAESSAPSLVNVVEAVEEALPLLRAAAGARHPISFVSSQPSAKTLIDRHRLSRIILNLVTNACEAMVEGGPVEISVDVTQVDGASGEGEPRYIVLAVRDRGHGIPHEKLERIFDPYVTTKVGGTGLGLSIVRSFVDQAGGFVRVESSPDAGTTVRVVLPRVSGDATVPAR